MDKKHQVGVYLKNILFAAVLFSVTAWLREIGNAANAAELFGVLSDCFLIPGVILGGIGLIACMSRTGVYDMLGYGASNFLSHFHIGRNRGEQPETYYEYKQRKTVSRGAGLPQMAIVGGACFACALVCLLIYFFLG